MGTGGNFGVSALLMNTSPLRTASHIGLWIAVIGIGIWLVWSATHTSTENNKYAPNSNPTDITHNGLRLADDINLFNFSCERHGLSDKWGTKVNANSTK